MLAYFSTFFFIENTRFIEQKLFSENIKTMFFIFSKTILNNNFQKEKIKQSRRFSKFNFQKNSFNQIKLNYWKQRIITHHKQQRK